MQGWKVAICAIHVACEPDAITLQRPAAKIVSLGPEHVDLPNSEIICGHRMARIGLRTHRRTGTRLLTDAAFQRQLIGLRS